MERMEKEEREENEIGIDVNEGKDIKVENIKEIVKSIKKIEEVYIGNGLKEDELMYGIKVKVRR